MDSDIQKQFDFKYVEGELHMYIKKEFVKELGWTDADLELSFGNIKKMNSFKGATLSINKIEDLWVASYRRGDYSEAHDHRDFDWSVVWYLDACTSCNPISFPDLKHPWLTHERIYPKVGNLHVFDAGLVHYVCPHTCPDHERIVVSGNLIHNEG